MKSIIVFHNLSQRFSSNSKTRLFAKDDSYVSSNELIVYMIVHSFCSYALNKQWFFIIILRMIADRNRTCFRLIEIGICKSCMLVKNFKVRSHHGKAKIIFTKIWLKYLFSIPTRTGLVQQPTQVAPVKRLASNTPVTKTRVSTMVKSQCSFSLWIILS